MKPELNTKEKIAGWLTHPVPAIFKGLNLKKDSQAIAKQPLKDCSFLGCEMEPILAEAIAKAGCMAMPPRPDLPFAPYTPGLYSPKELYDKFKPQGGDPEASYHECLDWRIYKSYWDIDNNVLKAVDVEEQLMRAIHDSSITDALSELLDMRSRSKCVAFMGGHDASRAEPVYAQTAKLALDLANQGYFIISGGGPGLMEAANLGAYCAGFADQSGMLAKTLERLNPNQSDKDWLSVGYLAWQQMGTPINPEKSRSVGIPTWFYGYEPPNVFATDIAKYFENSLREEGLLAVAQGGIIYAQGNGGTVQEIFQDANQNYYRTYGKVKSPMVLFGKDYWNPPAVNFNDPKNDKRKPAYLLLHKLATEKNFDDYVLLSDDPASVIEFIAKHPPVK